MFKKIKNNIITNKKIYIIILFLVCLVSFIFSIFNIKTDTQKEYLKIYTADVGITLSWPFPKQVGVYQLLYTDTDGADTFNENGAVTSWFGLRNVSVGSSDHKGIDIVSKNEDYNVVCAAAAGTVTLAGWNGGYGNCVIIQHEGGYETLYGHMSSIMVSER